MAPSFHDQLVPLVLYVLYLLVSLAGADYGCHRAGYAQFIEQVSGSRQQCLTCRREPRLARGALGALIFGEQISPGLRIIMIFVI